MLTYNFCFHFVLNYLRRYAEYYQKVFASSGSHARSLARLAPGVHSGDGELFGAIELFVDLVASIATLGNNAIQSAT